MENPLAWVWQTVWSMAPAGRFGLWVPGLVRCRVSNDLAEVTAINPEEVEPRAVGVDPVALEAVWEAALALYRGGAHPAVQLCVRRHGQVVLDRALGHVSGNGPNDPPDGPKVLATPATPFNIFSASKAITGTVVHLLVERGDIDLDERVCTYLPEFAAHGKEGITIRHLMTHRAGIPALPPEQMRPEKMLDPQETLRAICDLKPSWPPGRLAYHAVTGAHVLGEVVRRVTGKSIRVVLGKEILEPLGFRWMNYGVTRRDVPLVARNYFTGLPPPRPLAIMLERALGIDFRAAAEDSNYPKYMTAVLPAANIITTANELSRFFQLLLDEGKLDGLRILEPETVRRAIAPHPGPRFEIDGRVGLPLRYGLGFMLGGERVGLFGPDAGRAFGHLGYINILCWADPERQVTATLMTSGKPILYPEIYYIYEIARRIGVACAKTAPRRRRSPHGRRRRAAVAAPRRRSRRLSGARRV